MRDVLVCFSRILVTFKVITNHEEEVEGAETREMDKLGPYIPMLPVSTGQDINDDSEAQPVVSQAEGVTSIWPCFRILS